MATTFMATSFWSCIYMQVMNHTFLLCSACCLHILVSCLRYFCLDLHITQFSCREETVDWPIFKLTKSSTIFIATSSGQSLDRSSKYADESNTQFSWIGLTCAVILHQPCVVLSTGWRQLFYSDTAIYKVGEPGSQPWQIAKHMGQL